MELKPIELTGLRSEYAAHDLRRGRAAVSIGPLPFIGWNPPDTVCFKGV